MAVLGKIRQRSIFLILVIGMALFAFVISGVFDGSSSNAGPTDPIAVVNDEEIDVTFFRQMVEQTERAYNYSTLQSVNLVWNQHFGIQYLIKSLKNWELMLVKISWNKSFPPMKLSSIIQIFKMKPDFFDFGIFTDYIAQMRVQEPAAYENWKAQEQSIIGVANNEFI